MNLSPALRIMAVALVCVLGLIGVVVLEGNARASGREIMMEMAPVDPRSLLSGHYVTLNLQTTITGANACQNFGANADARWLSLVPNAPADQVSPTANAPTYAPRGQFASPDAAADGGALSVRGSATCDQLPDNEGKPQNAAIVRTEFENVSRFYIEQGEAERIGAMLRQQGEGPARVLAILSIGNDGRARLKGLWVEGRRLELNWL